VGDDLNAMSGEELDETLTLAVLVNIAGSFLAAAVTAFILIQSAALFQALAGTSQGGW
jgi:hypothetical protein